MPQSLSVLSHQQRSLISLYQIQLYKGSNNLARLNTNQLVSQGSWFLAFYETNIKLAHDIIQNIPLPRTGCSSSMNVDQFVKLIPAHPSEINNSFLGAQKCVIILETDTKFDIAATKYKNYSLSICPSHNTMHNGSVMDNKVSKKETHYSSCSVLVVGQLLLASFCGVYQASDR